MSTVIKIKHKQVAELCLECVRRIKESNHVKRLPSMIVNNGLIPTLVFYKSEGKDRGQIFQYISEILEKLGFKPYLDWKNNNPNKDLLETDEVLNIVTWFKRRGLK